MQHSGFLICVLEEDEGDLQEVAPGGTGTANDTDDATTATTITTARGLQVADALDHLPDGERAGLLVKNPAMMLIVKVMKVKVMVVIVRMCVLMMRRARDEVDCEGDDDDEGDDDEVSPR